mgnify:CR=1 FL=1|jgi:hypothetical protein|tara:strand:- start:56112 stop:56405 length:294 start_codon:yes stop_codon:yes gene_type:complete
MIVGRLLAYIFLCLAIMVLGAEGLRLLEGGDGEWITVGQVVDLIPLAETAGIESEAEGANVKRSWEIILEPLSNFSALFASMILSGILFFLSRSRFR